MRAMPRRLVQLAGLLLLALSLAGCKPSQSGSSGAPNSPADQFLSLMNALRFDHA